MVALAILGSNRRTLAAANAFVAASLGVAGIFEARREANRRKD
jgi:hypothetical protein